MNITEAAVPIEGHIRTYTGVLFPVLDPKWEMIDIRDIAHSLSMQCRFAGHTRFHYSVAQHSVLVSLAIERSLRNFPSISFPNDFLHTRRMALWGLLHDASEAYSVDLPRPLKYSGKLDAYKEIEQRILQQVIIWSELEWPEPPLIKEMDNRLLATEQRDLFHFDRSPKWKQQNDPLKMKISYWGPFIAEQEFLSRYRVLTGQSKWVDRWWRHAPYISAV